MTGAAGEEILLQFLDEARGYLPQMRAAIEGASTAKDPLEALAEIHRLAHGVRGAAGMVGLGPLGQIAFFVEDAIERIGLGEIAADEASFDALRETVDRIEDYIEGVAAKTLQARPLLARVMEIFRRLQGLPESGDAAELQRLLPPDCTVLGEAGASESDARSPVGASPPISATPHRISAEFLEAFAQEAEEYFQKVGADLRALRDAEDPERIRNLRRTVHTLKGAAATVGLTAAGGLAHRMEDLLDRLSDGESLTEEKLDLLFRTHDALVDLTRCEADGEAPSDDLSEIYALYEQFLGASEFAAPGASAVSEIEGPDLARPSAEELAIPRGEPSQSVRVPIARLDELVRLVSELMVTRSRFEQHHQELAREVDELRLSMARLGRLAHRIETEYEIPALAGEAFGAGAPQTELFRRASSSSSLGSYEEFDELELDRYTEFHLLSRELSETAGDIASISAGLHDSVGDFDASVHRMARRTNEVQHQLMRLRMVPFATLSERLERAVRVTARSLGKKVDLDIEGERTAFDKSVLEEIADPLHHLIRNAVDHGIESLDVRRAYGKNEQGVIRIKAFYEGAHAVIEVSDDGGGLHVERLRTAAIEQGWASAEEADELADEDLQALVFQPGFSTASEISEVSGRGVGLDAVRASVHRVKGSIALTSRPGEGTTFTLRLPMTLAMTRGLLVNASGRTYAIPLAAVAEILRVDDSELEISENRPVLQREERALPVFRLGEILGLPPPAEPPSRSPMLVLRVGDRQFALAVDRIRQARDLVIKSLGGLLRKVRGVSAATLTGDGTVVLILDPVELVEAAIEADRGTGRSGPRRTAAVRETIDILIVDDSISVRKVLSHLVVGAGWNAIAAKDGMEALETLQGLSKPPDVVLLDLEMPRMDGFELTSALRGRELYAETPIVILTSRGGPKHRRHALGLGASEYLVKPCRGEILLDVMRRWIRSPNTMKQEEAR